MRPMGHPLAVALGMMPPHCGGTRAGKRHWAGAYWGESALVLGLRGVLMRAKLG